ncbi:MAG: hypothetical protein ACREFX_12030, partial [Opitutaceae bacterium]
YLLTPEKIAPFKRRRERSIQIHLVQPRIPRRLRPPVAPPQQYVEANPNAPENKPDHTNNFSDRNQQAAQEHPTAKSKSDRPTLKGKKDIQSNQIVNGRLVPPQPIAPPTPKTTLAVVKRNATPKREENPLSGKERDIGKSPTGFGTDIAKAENNKPIPNQIKGSNDAPLLQMSPFTTPAIDPKHPRQRPTLDVYSRPAVFADNPVGTSNLGITGIDARWNSYGVYLKRMLEIVQAEFDKVVDESQIYPPPGSEVRVTFKLTSQGKISQIVSVTKSPNCTDPAQQNCVISITTPAPYDPWTDDMIAMLGTEQQMTFIFYYE